MFVRGIPSFLHFHCRHKLIGTPSLFRPLLVQYEMLSSTTSSFADANVLKLMERASKPRQDRTSIKFVKDMFENARDDEFFFLPLGGSGEIGMNCNLYVNKNRFLMIDLGILLVNIGHGSTSVLPDISFIKNNVEKLDGLVVTHAHEDHIGAIETLWPSLKCPIYCTKFTAAMITPRIERRHPHLLPLIHVIDQEDTSPQQVGNFEFRFCPTTHSIPESVHVFINTPYGYIMHTGDWNMDTTPTIGPAFSLDALQKFGDSGVHAVIGDSTNATRTGHTTSERFVRKGLLKRLKAIPRGKRVVVTCFSSSISRIKAVMEAARGVGRVPILAGRSLLSTTMVAHSCGYLPSTKGCNIRTANKYHGDKDWIIVSTGCQGEPNSALSRMATGDHPHVSLSKGDVVIFSSRTIPGNEEDVATIISNLKELGVEVILDGDDGISTHSSGHALAGDIFSMLSAVRPFSVIPVHGEQEHMQKHTDIALTAGIKHVLIPTDGDVIRICGERRHKSDFATVSDTPSEAQPSRTPADVLTSSPHTAMTRKSDPPQPVAHFTTHPLVKDGLILRRLDSDAIKQRAMAGTIGTCTVTLNVDGDGFLSNTAVVYSRDFPFSSGLDSSHDNELNELIANTTVDHHIGNSESAFKVQVHKTVTSFCVNKFGKTPFVQTHIIRPAPATSTPPTREELKQHKNV
eukprot:m.23872 g.23872  ORF g.23872 m.23872 type:complete len:686 (-) comp9039_c0_seq1:83-2140(-)